MAQPKKTFYDILGVPREATANDIGLMYDKRKAQLERAGAEPGEIALLRQAHDTLGDPGRRAAYDASLTTADERSAAASQATPDLVIEGEPAPARRNPPWIAIIGIVAVIAIATLFALRTNKEATAKPDNTPAPGSAEPAKPAPAAPVAKSGKEIIADASTSGGQVLSFSMSGQAIPIGLAVSTEDGTMVTTCHGIPAGAKLVVRVQGQSYPADLLITDEQLDLCKLQVANFHTPPVKLAAEELKADDRIFVVGVNKAGEFAVTEGTLKRVLETTEGRLYELSMPVGEFSSGGGVFDAYGRLAGIATYQHRAGVSIAYPAASIAQMRSRQVPR
jgi:serine protease Do